MLYSQLGYYVLTAITFPYLFSGLRWGLEYTAGREDKWESDERWFNHFKDLDTIIEGIKSIKIFAWEQIAGDLVAIVGKTGAGKSSLLLAMCSEVEMTQGTGRLVGKIAYLEQQPWIMNDTLRANVLFGREYDEDYYWKVLSTCALIDDLEMWPNSDLTVIGENGMNISGGQRARLALARTVYSKADIYFLDDPLSAVDAIVKRHILDNIILSTGLLGDKLRFVTSNADSISTLCNQIAMVDNGHVSVKLQA
ncbi:ATP-binding cassette glutathione S-conjugate transporter ycf1 [Coemansia sp. RSA 2673]|nr:ATP-binding cassette glutathione S-conjugate transporter ycf1 [Coemansia sp. RSA 2673]